MPREHGAWGMLLIPFIMATGISGVFGLKMLMLLASVLGLYVARASFLKRNTGWTVILVATSAACGAPLLLFWQLWWLLPFGGAAALLAFRWPDRGLVSELVAVVGLTMTAPVAWYVATGVLDALAFLLWVLNALYFDGTVFHVKMNITAAARRKPFEGLWFRLRFGWSNLLAHGVMAVLLIAGAAAEYIPWLVALAYAPSLARSVVGVARLSPTLRIKRLGWLEVAHSVVFLTMMIVAFRVT
jgi:hypothetical protein